MLFEVTKTDKIVYAEQIRDFLPARIIDVHSHVWLEGFDIGAPKDKRRAVTWPSLVAKDNSAEDLIKGYRLLLPGKEVTPLIFGMPLGEVDLDKNNAYTSACAAKYGLPALMLTRPDWSSEEFERKIIGHSFLGTKVYLTFAPAYVPESEIRIYDFLPPHQLEVINRHGWIVMLHIPRPGRLADPVNLAQMIEIDRQYPDIKLIIAHVGRAYCPENTGNAFEVLTQTKNMMFDISANTNAEVFEKLIKAVGPKRILFGSDMPVSRMRMRRICETGNYVNLVPKGLYGDVSADRHMREIAGEEASKLTFFMYEQINAFHRAADAAGLTGSDIEDVFYSNAHRVIESTNPG